MRLTNQDLARLNLVLDLFVGLAHSLEDNRFTDGDLQEMIDLAADYSYRTNEPPYYRRIELISSNIKGYYNMGRGAIITPEET
jgi:collagenase-like PrtC family protease